MKANDVGRCIHHWLLARPSGGQVEGRCKRCGRARTFSEQTESLFALRRNRSRARKPGTAAGTATG